MKTRDELREMPFVTVEQIAACGMVALTCLTQDGMLQTNRDQEDSEEIDFHKLKPKIDSL